MIVVAPLREVVCEFQARGIGGCVFKVDHDELFVRILWEEKRRRGVACRWRLGN